MAMIELVDVHKSFGANHVIRGFSTTVTKGEVVCIVGPSGSGKSTILRCINGLEGYDSGTVLVEGKWGWMGVYMHRLRDCLYGPNVTFLRSDRRGHALRLSPANNVVPAVSVPADVALEAEPLWVDFTALRGQDEHRGNPVFLDGAATLAAAIRRTDKDASLGDEVRQQMAQSVTC